MKVLPGLIVIALVVVVAFAPANGQQPGSITGVVRDSAGAVLPGVTVNVAGAALGSSRRIFVTDRQGRYTVTDLPAGSYTLMFRLPGFSETSVADLVVTGITPTTHDVVMQVGPIGDMLTLDRFAPPLPFPQLRAPREASAECLHGPDESDAERQRRVEAVAAMNLIYNVLEQVPAGRGGYPSGYPDWPTLGRSAAVAALKKRPGPVGELANKMQWGAAEPLPGWRITYTTGALTVSYSLRDFNDPCWFTLSSHDPNVIPPRAVVRPLTPHLGTR